MIYENLKGIQQWLFPGSCVLCAARIASGEDFCPQCERSLPYLAGGCPQCASPMMPTTASGSHCGECQRRPPAFSRTLAMFHYSSPIDRLIQSLKYHHRLEIARVLGQRLARFLQTHGVASSNLLIPVPLHTTRLRERGFNQSLELARPVAKRLGLSLDYTCATRTRQTAPQTDLAPKARQRNVRGAFRASDAVAGRRVAILDDVMTTGHTVDSLARCLRRAGARDVEVWVVARA